MARSHTIVLVCLSSTLLCLQVAMWQDSPTAQPSLIGAVVDQRINKSDANPVNPIKHQTEEKNSELQHFKRDSHVATNDASRKDGPLLCNTTWLSSPADPKDAEFKHDQQGCRHQQSITCTGKRLKRALVIYMLQTKNVRDMAVELNSFDFFMNVGVFGEHESTEMFERVDYVFTRMMPPHLGKVSVPTIIAEKGNIKLMWVPSGPCDLCAHGRVITHLGGVEAVKAKYSFLALLNGGSRGPFQAANDAAWIDVMAVGGQATWSAATPPIMVGPTVSTQHSVHVQTYCIGLHTARLTEYYQFLSRCDNSEGGKHKCIHDGEVPAGIEWLRGGGWIHSLSSNDTLRSLDDSAALAQARKRIGFVEPTHRHYDLCSALFAKFGGTFTNRVRERTAAHAAQLILLYPLNRTLPGRVLLRELLASGRFLHLSEGVDYVSVMSAWYGVPGKIEIRDGVVERLRQSIAKNHGRLVVSNNLTEFFGFDPAPNGSKTLAIRVRYNEREHELRALDGKVFEFPSDKDKNYTVIINAWYGVPGKVEFGAGVAERLRENVIQNNGRLVLPNNFTRFFGVDPAPTVLKTLAIHLRYDEQVHYLRVSDGEAFRFPEV